MDRRRKNTQQLGIKEDTKTFNWRFELDKIHDYAFWDNFLSKEECEKIITLGKSKNLLKGNVLNKKLTKVRKSNVSWLAPSDNLDWLYRKLTDSIVSLNKRFFNFDLIGIEEGLQFTNYNAPSGKYDYHVDRAYNFQIRKLSATIQLSNPNDYEGGNLELLNGTKPIPMKKDQGRLIVFPSFILHRVTPITKGERNSLVSWITGPHFK